MAVSPQPLDGVPWSIPSILTHGALTSITVPGHWPQLSQQCFKTSLWEGAFNMLHCCGKQSQLTVSAQGRLSSCCVANCLSAHLGGLSKFWFHSFSFWEGFSPCLVSLRQRKEIALVCLSHFSTQESWWCSSWLAKGKIKGRAADAGLLLTPFPTQKAAVPVEVN